MLRGAMLSAGSHGSAITEAAGSAAAVSARGSGSAAASLTVHDTICGQVASRHSRLAAFASSHDAIVFVSGKSSSNGKVLSDLCRSVNPRTFLVGGPSEIDPSWFSGLSTVGVCGATSTPQWLLEQVAGAIASL